MAVEIEIPDKHYEMRAVSEMPAVRVLRMIASLSVKLLFLAGVLYMAVPSSGPDTPVRTIPDYTRIGGIATLVSGPPDPVIEFNQYVSWISPPRPNLDFFTGLDDIAESVSAPEQQTPGEDADAASSMSDHSIRPTPEATTVAFFVPDSFGGSGWDLTTSDGSSFILAARPGFGPIPEPSSWILLATGIAGLALYRRRRRVGAR